jgi:hypothetical protein
MNAPTDYTLLLLYKKAMCINIKFCKCRYGVAIICCIQKIRIKENGVRYALRFLMPTK